MSGKWKVKWGKGGVLLLAVMLILSACSTSSDNANSAGDNAAADYDLADSGGSMKAESGSSDGSTVAVTFSEAAGLANSVAPRAPESGAGERPSLGQQVGEDGLNRKLIYRANLSMRVKDFSEAYSEVQDLVHVSGAYILEFSNTVSTSEEGGRFVIKVPSHGFQSFIANLEAMKPISLQQTVQGQDVTEEYVDLESRLKAKEVVEARLLSFMDKASNANDLVSFSRELGQVQEEIEQLKGRMRYLDQNVAYSTVDLRLYQSESSLSGLNAEAPPLWQRAQEALSGSLDGVQRFLAGVVVFFAGALPVLLLLAIILLPAYFYGYRRLKRRGMQSTPSTQRDPSPPDPS